MVEEQKIDDPSGKMMAWGFAGLLTIIGLSIVLCQFMTSDKSFFVIVGCGFVSSGVCVGICTYRGSQHG